MKNFKYFTKRGFFVLFFLTKLQVQIIANDEIYLSKNEAEQIIQSIPNFSEYKLILKTNYIVGYKNSAIRKLYTAGLAIIKDKKNNKSNSYIIDLLRTNELRSIETFRNSFPNILELKNNQFKLKKIETKEDLALVYYCLKNSFVENKNSETWESNNTISGLIFQPNNNYIYPIFELSSTIGLFEFGEMASMGINKKIIKDIFQSLRFEQINRNDRNYNYGLYLEGYSIFNVYKENSAIESITSFIELFKTDSELMSFLNSKKIKDALSQEEMILLTSKYPNVFDKIQPRYFELSRYEKEKVLGDFIYINKLNVSNLSDFQDLIDLFLNVGVFHDDASLSKTKEKYKSKSNKYDNYRYSEYAYNIEGLVVNTEDYILHFGFYDDSDFDTNKILLRLSCTFKNKLEFDKFKIIFQHFDLSDYKAGNTRFYKNSKKYIEQRNGQDFINMWGHPPYDGLLEINENNNLISLYNYRGNSTPAFSLNKNKFSSETTKELNQYEYEKLEKTYNRNVNFLSSFNNPFEVSRSSSSSDNENGFQSFLKETKLTFLEKGNFGGFGIGSDNAYYDCPCEKYEIETPRNDRHALGASYKIIKDNSNKWWIKTSLGEKDIKFDSLIELKRYFYDKKI